MTGVPHPISMTALAAQRVADLHAEAERDRLCACAEATVDRPQPWPDRPLARAIASALAIVAAMWRC